MDREECATAEWCESAAHPARCAHSASSQYPREKTLPSHLCLWMREGHSGIESRKA